MKKTLKILFLSKPEIDEILSQCVIRKRIVNIQTIWQNNIYSYYFVFLMLLFAFPSKIQAQNIDIADSTRIIGVPNVFSPNGDLNNDTFGLNLVACTTVRLEIYNRWGNLVFDSQKQQSQFWDGKFQDKDCPSGVYFWTAKVLCDFENKTEYFKGNVTLIR